MEPTPKAPAINDLLNRISDDNRVQAIQSDRCINPPMGCGQSISAGFRDQISTKEYTISGLCQNCQDRIFGISDE